MVNGVYCIEEDNEYKLVYIKYNEVFKRWQMIRYPDRTYEGGKPFDVKIPKMFIGR